MSEAVRKINEFFRDALNKDIEHIKLEILLSDRQKDVFERFYLRKQDINFIADTLGVCPMVINNELKAIRKKLIKIIDNL